MRRSNSRMAPRSSRSMPVGSTGLLGRIGGLVFVAILVLVVPSLAQRDSAVRVVARRGTDLVAGKHGLARSNGRAIDFAHGLRAVQLLGGRLLIQVVPHDGFLADGVQHAYADQVIDKVLDLERAV